MDIIAVQEIEWRVEQISLTASEREFVRYLCEMREELWYIKNVALHNRDRFPIAAALVEDIYECLA